MIAWLLSGDSDIEEVDINVGGVLLLPDDKLVRVHGLISELTDNRQSLENGTLSACDKVVSLHLSNCQ